MASTLVAVFDDNSAARRACDRLVSEGLIDRDAVRVTAAGDAERIGDGSASQHQQHQGGIRGFFASLFGSGDSDDDSSGHYAEAVRRGSAVLTVEMQDDAQVERASDLLEECGAIDVDERVERWRAGGWTGHDASAPMMSSDEIQRERENLQVVQEDLKVGKRTVGRGGVRVHRRISEVPVEEQLELREEQAVVERRPVDRAASAADMAAFKDAEVEIRETAEEPVVSKSARVVEEVSIGKKQSRRTETIRDTVRRSDVEVERLDGGRADMGAGMASEPVPGALLGGYRGPERRFNTQPYGGSDRRMGA